MDIAIQSQEVPARFAIPQIKMAPIRSIKKQTNRAKPSAGSGVSLPKPSLVDDDFRTTKRDKRLIKHSSFVSKIEKTSAKSGKRRRASKKLVANLESLADALPEAESNLNDPSQLNIIKQKTLKHRPGAMKRKEKLEKSERDRFAKNMAQMSNLPTAPTSNSEPAVADSMSNRWAALRGFISNTMEHQPAFKTNK
ncbi:ribosome biogenesis protein SLX9-domain-containing protein [Aspergillus varians]